MAEIVVMPKLGFNMEEGKLVRWHKKEGDPIKKGEVFFEIITDKTTIEIEAAVDGVVRKILAQEGEKVPVTLPVAIIAGEDEDITECLREAEAMLGRQAESGSGAPETVAPAPAPGAPAGNSARFTPRALKFMAEHDIDPAGVNVKGTGYDGGVTERDIMKHLDQIRGARATPVARKLAADAGVDLKGVAGTGSGGKIMKADVQRAMEQKAGLPKEAAAAAGPKEILEVIPYDGMRKIIGDRLSHSKFTAPHVYFSTSVDVSGLYSLREQIQNAVDTRVSLNDMIIAAAARALVKHPMLNSSLEGDQIVVYRSVNIGVAVGLDNGLIVPVIRDAQNKKLSRIAGEARELTARARSNKLLPDDYSGGTFTISNLGMFGVENFTAIINPPETGILAVSSVRKTPVVISRDGEDVIEIRPLMNMTLSVDHRIIDGLAATRFLNEIKDLLENPVKILV
ncbi:MAG: dihydrolipoamide acetyltransferase family protein [Bacillota bacterium]